jgi:hypothetical protein
MAMDEAQSPPNGRELLALYQKPTSHWTRDDDQRVWQIVKDWTGDNHKAFGDLLREWL